jgi:hypothetical protein
MYIFPNKRGHIYKQINIHACIDRRNVKQRPLPTHPVSVSVGVLQARHRHRVLFCCCWFGCGCYCCCCSFYLVRGFGLIGMCGPLRFEIHASFRLKPIHIIYIYIVYIHTHTYPQSTNTHTHTHKPPRTRNCIRQTHTHIYICTQTHLPLAHRDVMVGHALDKAVLVRQLVQNSCFFKI